MLPGDLQPYTARADAGTVAGLIDNSQNGDIEANQLSLTAANLKNQGGHISQWQSGPTTLAVSGTLDNSNGGVIQTNSTDLTLAPAVLDNSKGTITHGGTGTLTLAPGNGAGDLKNIGGTIGTNGQAIVKAGSLDNGSGVIAAKLGLSATIAGAMNNAQGLMRSNAALSIISNGALSNQQGHIEAGTAGDTSTLSIQAASIDNTDGAVHGFGTGKMTVQGGSQIVNSHAGGVDGMGQMTSQGDVTISAASISNTQGGQLMGANLRVQGNSLDNSGGQVGTLHVKGSDLVAGKDVTGTAANIVVDSATDTSHQAQQQQTSKSGLTVGLSGSVGDAINNAISETQAARESAKDSNGRASALHSIATVGDVAFGGMGAAKLLDGAKGPQAPSIGVPAWCERNRANRFRCAQRYVATWKCIQ